MHLQLSGHPLHSRSLTVKVEPMEDGRILARAELVDLRKRGFVPLAGQLQPSGVIHHMKVRGILNPATRVLDEIEAEQPTVAFEPSPLTRGESCRDPVRSIEALAGTRIVADLAYAKALNATIGGPRGCSHVLVLGQLLGSTLAWALDRECERYPDPGEAPIRRPGEAIFHRSLLLDASEAETGIVQLAFQLGDLHFARAPALAPPMDRFAAQQEVRGLAVVDVDGATLQSLIGAERHRERDEIESAEWTTLDGRLKEFTGAHLLAGFGRRLVDGLHAHQPDRPLLDALLNLAPVFIQCMGALSESWPAEASRRPSLVGTGGHPDSCYMWRSEGPLAIALSKEIASGGVVHRARRGRRDSA
ncbi:MAG: DUF2889 domain-containing protein [Myxococcota bacterium]